MPKSVEKVGRTVEEAVKMAIEDLNVSEDEVEIEILDEGNKGLLGLLGMKKQVKVKVTVKEGHKRKVEQFLRSILEEMNIDANMVITQEEDVLKVSLKGDKLGVLIGRRGETLNALQYLVGIVANKGEKDHRKVVIDVCDYRKKREEILIKFANKIAKKVIASKKSITLEPMSSYERRIIHSALQQNKHVETYSIGEEPNRKIVIALKNK